MHGVFGAFTPIRVSTKAENCADIARCHLRARDATFRLPVLPIFEPSIRIAAIVVFAHIFYVYIYIYIFFVILNKTVIDV